MTSQCCLENNLVHLFQKHILTGLSPVFLKIISGKYQGSDRVVELFNPLLQQRGIELAHYHVFQFRQVTVGGHANRADCFLTGKLAAV